MNGIRKTIAILLSAAFVFSAAPCIGLAANEEPVENVTQYSIPLNSSEIDDKTLTVYEIDGDDYMDLKDIARLTRCEYEKQEDMILLKRGVKVLMFFTKICEWSDSGLKYQGAIKLKQFGSSYLCEGIPMLTYLGAKCFVLNESSIAEFNVMMPKFTFEEAFMSDYFFNAQGYVGDKNDIFIELYCDIIMDIFDIINGKGIKGFWSFDEYYKDALHDILKIDMYKYESTQQLAKEKDDKLRGFLRSGKLSEVYNANSEIGQTVFELYADYYMSAKISILDVHQAYQVIKGNYEAASIIGQQINSDVCKQLNVQNIGGGFIDIASIALSTANNAFEILCYDKDTRTLFSSCITDEVEAFTGYNVDYLQRLTNEISACIETDQSIVANALVEGVMDWLQSELIDIGLELTGAKLYALAIKIVLILTRLISWNEFNAYSEDMDMIFLASTQSQIAELATRAAQKTFLEEQGCNAEHIETVKNLMTLYYRTTIAFCENAIVSIEEFGNPRSKESACNYLKNVADRMAKYLYMMTNCKVIPIVDYSELNDEDIREALDALKTENALLQVPEGYDPNSYLKLRAFFETEDENGVKNGDKLWTNDYNEDGGNIYDPDDPETWYTTYGDEGQQYIDFKANEEGLLEVCGVDFNCSALVGELDISGISKLYTVATYGNEGITGLNTEGCDIERLYCYGNSLSEVDWCCEEKNIVIHLASVGSGFVSVDYDTYEDEWEYWTGNAYWCVYARPVQGKEFIGWYDENGNCVGNDLKYEFAVAPDNEPEVHWGDSPTDIHLNLEARFETGLEPTPAPVASVTFHDPAFEAAFRKKYNITGAITMDMILSYEELDLSGCGLVDITDAAMFKNLTELDLGFNEIADISPLSELINLTKLNLAHQGHWGPQGSYFDSVLSDISPLSGLTNLTELDLGTNNISDISPLVGLTKLICLDISCQFYGYTDAFSDISPLAGLTNLTELDLYLNQISDLSSLSGLTNLTKLQLADNQISDISPLAGLTNLTNLNLSNNDQISDISPLAGLTNLTVLYLWENEISDLSPLSGLTNLTRLNLSNNDQISDISPLSGLTKLTRLSLEDNQISDISPLSELTNLEYLDLRANKLTASTDVSPLFNLTLLETLSIKYGNSLTQEQINAIQEHLPNCTIS